MSSVRIKSHLGYLANWLGIHSEVRGWVELSGRDECLREKELGPTFRLCGVKDSEEEVVISSTHMAEPPME